MSKIRIGILGIGAIGSVISSQLLNNPKVELFYFNRSTIERILLKSSTGNYDYKIDCRTSPAEKHNLDWLIICLKEYAFSSAEHWFNSLISEKTNIVVIRNGINLKEPLLPYSKCENIVECMIDCPVQRDKNGVLLQFKKPKITTETGKTADKFKCVFSGSEVKIEQTEDFLTASWIKLCESTALGALTCLTGKKCEIFVDRRMQIAYQNIIKECYEVAIADGAKLTKSYIEEMLLKLKSYPPEKGSSMLADRLNGKEIELGAKSGIVVEIGKKRNVDTSLNSLICSFVRNNFSFDLNAFI